MKRRLNKCLGLLLLVGLGFASVVSQAQPLKPEQALPVHIIRIKQTDSKLTSTSSLPSDKDQFLNSIQLVNKADTAYVQKDWQEDMGYVYALQYIFKNNLPDGLYRLFINDKIQQEVIFISGKMEGMYKEYVDGVLDRETYFRNGKANEYAYDYHSSTGGLRRITYLCENQTYIRTSIGLGGNVVGREYFVNGSHFRVEGKIFNEYSDSPMTKKGIVATGIRNGLYELVSPDGKYQLFFDRDNIKWWRWLDKQGNNVVEVHAKPGQRL